MKILRNRIKVPIIFLMLYPFPSENILVLLKSSSVWKCLPSCGTMGPTSWHGDISPWCLILRYFINLLQILSSSTLSYIYRNP